MKKNQTNNLDEMQEQKLFQLEEYGFWIIFWALLAAIIIQLILGGTLKEVLGEIIALLLGSIFVLAAALKNGLWAKTSAPSQKGNAIISIVPAVLIGVIHVLKIIHNNRSNAKNLLITAAVMVAVYAACLGVLELFRAIYSKRRAKLDTVHDEGKEE